MASPQRAGSRWVGCVALIIVACIALVVAVGLFAFFTNRTSAASVLGPIVNIQTPETGDRAELNTALLVQARAEHSSRISRAELYADGALVAVQSSTLPSGSNPFIFLQTWTPTITGTHVLMVRAYAGNGEHADSSITLVEVVPLLQPSVTVDVSSIPRREGSPLPSLNDLSAATGIPVERLRESNPPLRGLDPTRPITAGTPIDLPRSPAPPPGGAPPAPPGAPPAPPAPPGAPPAPPVPLPDAPAAPTGLIATAECTSARLNWTDSPDEEQYIIYRIAPGDARLNRIATLAANTTTYRDTLPGLGIYRYQIAALRGTREGLSGMAETRTDESCSGAVPPDAVRSRILIALITVDTTNAFDRGVYCYYQINTTPWDRAPGADSLTPIAGNPRRYDLTRLPGRGRSLIDHPESSPVSIGLECWGRTALESNQLNPRFATSIPSAQWDGTLREIRAPNGSFTLRYCISRSEDRCNFDGRITPLGGAGSFPVIELPPGLLVPLRTLPSPRNLQIRGGADACDELPTDRERGLCALAIIFGGVPTLYWDWNGAPFYAEASITGYRVVARDYTSGLIFRLWDRDVRPGSHKFTLARTGGMPCGRRVSFVVKAIAGTRESAWSDAIGFDTPACPPPPPTAVQLDITFETMELRPSLGRANIIDSGDICIFCEDRRLELYGALVIRKSGDHFGPTWTWGGDRRFEPGRWENNFEYWMERTFPRSPFQGVCEYTSCLTQGTYRWSEQFLFPPGDPYIARGPVTSRITLREGESLLIDPFVMDWDILNSNDIVCSSHLELSKSLREWSTTNEVFTMNSDRGEASCTITVRIIGRVAP